MSRHAEKVQPARRPAEDVEGEIARLGAMTVSELRSVWRETFRSEPPIAFSKQLLARAIAYRLQEEAYGGLRPPDLRLLRAMAKTGSEPPRQVKAGSVIVREHKGITHEVMVVPGGFCWRGQTFDSLSSIAKRITGVSWNGPRFFGLRAKKDPPADGDPVGGVDLPPAPPAPGGGRVSSRKQARRSGRRSSIGTGAAP